MAYQYNRFYADNGQTGHQLHWDQVLETYPLNNGPNFVPGAYLADGSVMSFGNDCTVIVNDKYNMPGCCSTWASGREQEAQCCPCSAPAVFSATVPPPPTFPMTIDQELALIK